MLHALLKKKLRVTDTSLEYRDVEDHLTASVLTRISYLPASVATHLLEASMVAHRFGVQSNLSEVEDDVWVKFWPRYADAEDPQCTVEPDAILMIGGQPFVVEAKRTDEWGQYAEQTVRDWLSYAQYEDDEGEGLKENAGTLLLLGGVVDGNHFVELCESIKKHIDEFDPRMLPRVAWISWARLASTVRDFIHHATPQNARILEDIDLSLTHHGFGAWLTFAQLRGVVECSIIRIGDGALPIYWPDAPKFAPLKPVPHLPHPFDDWRRLTTPISAGARPTMFPLFSKQDKQWKSKI